MQNRRIERKFRALVEVEKSSEMELQIVATKYRDATQRKPQAVVAKNAIHAHEIIHKNI
jgi:hypothetical protein